MQQAYVSNALTAESMKSLSNEIEKQAKEKDLDREMTNQKRAQDSLHEALERRRAELLATTKTSRKSNCRHTVPNLRSSFQTTKWRI